MGHSTIQKAVSRTVLVLCVCLTLILAVHAEDTLFSDCEYNFTGSEFVCSLSGDMEGIYVSSVPEQDVCRLCLGERVIRAGDFLPQSALDKLVLRPVSQDDSTASISYMAIADGKLDKETAFTMQIKSARDEAPVAEDSALETYKNIANTGTLRASDPEGSTLTYTIQTRPKRGSVEIREDGTFLYTPKKNKVGEDCFTYTATDAAGNTSAEATVNIRIMQPVDDTVFDDVGSDCQFTAMWMRGAGLYGGELLADKLCFCPDKEVTRGEFLVMTMKLAGIDPEIGLLTSGFSDQEQAADWMQPYLVSAMRRGIVTGYPSESGLLFQPNQPITAAEAAVMVTNTFHLESVAVSATDGAELSWTQSAVAALSQAGISLTSDAGDILTRQAAAELLYQAGKLSESK